MKLVFEKTCGVVRLLNWTIMPDGESYINIWCANWEIITDKMMPVDGFKSSEKWQLAAVLNGEVVLFIPGCQVKGWVRVENPEKMGKSIYKFK